MQQIAALGALALASLLHLNVVRVDHAEQASARNQEVEALGADVVQSTFERLATLPFDAAADPKSVGDLTSRNGFGGAPWDEATDLDDIHGATTVVSVPGPDGVGALGFSLSARVAYVQKSGTSWVDAPGNVRTFYKRVTITTVGLLGVQSTVERVFTPTTF